MAAVWYTIVALMLTGWAVLDGFDLGAGIVQHMVSENEDERGDVLAAIGPVWDGNEVWLVAGGAVLVFAFPRTYAVAFSGMYLALVMVLWLLVFRGVAIELRAQLSHPLWRTAWDGLFALSSTVMALVTGVAMGNVVRGVPIDASGWFHLDLFSLAGPHTGAIGLYTGFIGIMAIVVLAAHGATYLAWKIGGDAGRRSVAVAQRAWVLSTVLAVAATIATGFVRPALFVSLLHRPWLWPLAIVVLASPAFILRSLARRAELLAFLASCAFVASLLLMTAGSLYPVMLASTVDPSFDLDAQTASSGPHGLTLGLAWWVPAIALAVFYTVTVYRSMRGKVGGAEVRGH
jgi:cytochrome d ubiquinol oxidase subunit II